MRRTGFTLIELLIVVAIIAILAAIAVPNFLEAQTRAKVSRAKADIRSLATAIEAYRIDHNAYPNDVELGWPWYVPTALSTPVAYITNAFLLDPFRTAPTDSTSHLTGISGILTMRFRYVNYIAGRDTWPVPGGGTGTHGVTSEASAQDWLDGIENFGQWKLSSAGPDGRASYPFLPSDLIYDATNGTVSQGDIIRSQREPEATQHDVP
ncbi:prepilin-type N-terminal cleavage/methylation domain-containing protein [Candidatus Sumerlaeota bacterium]|nr:prepilin-type N-terminal cleavage/methylation domain-containing protein [Candidatus Sumerlaeota bacterium]